MFRNLRRITFNLAYLFKPRWDTGIPAPELVRFIAGKPPGNAIDVGCGTGTNLLYLARRKWKVTGIDFAPLAIARAERKMAGYPGTLLVGDVTKLSGLRPAGSVRPGTGHGLFPQSRRNWPAGVCQRDGKMGQTGGHFDALCIPAIRFFQDEGDKQAGNAGLLQGWV